MKKTIPSIVALAFLAFSTVSSRAEWIRTVALYDTRTLGAEHMEIGADADYWQLPKNAGNTARLSPGVRLAFLDAWDIAANTAVLETDAKTSTNGAPLETQSGVGDSTISTTYRFLDLREYTCDLAGRFAISLPTGNEDKRLGTDATDCELAALVAAPVGPVTLVGNAGIVFTGSSDVAGDDNEFFLGVEAIRLLSDWPDSLNGALQFRLDREGDPLFSTAFGATYMVTRYLQVRGRGEVGLSSDTPDWLVSVGFSYLLF